MAGNRSQAVASRDSAKARGARRPASETPASRSEPTPADLRKELSEIPIRVRRQSWQIQFLVEELRTVSTEVERGVILDWLEQAKRERKDLEVELKERQTLYEQLMRQRRRRTAGARAKGRQGAVAVQIRAVDGGDPG